MDMETLGADAETDVRELENYDIWYIDINYKFIISAECSYKYLW